MLIKVDVWHMTGILIMDMNNDVEERFCHLWHMTGIPIMDMNDVEERFRRIQQQFDDIVNHHLTT